MAAWQQAGKAAGKGVAKRPAPPTVAPPNKAIRPGAAPSAADSSAIVVYCTDDKDEIGIRTLVGEYKEEGSNHGRKFYRKTQKIPGHENVSVYLYYWDERDGPTFSGWWFGNQVGGAQVWSRNAQSTQRPPRTGWTIPWDGEVKKELVVAPAAEAKQSAAKAAAAAKLEARRREESEKADEVAVGEWEERVEQATLQAAEAEVGAQEAIEMAREALDSDDFDEVLLQECQSNLTSQAAAVAETQRAVAVESLAAAKAPAALKAEMVALTQRLRQLQATVKDELMRVKNHKQVRAQREQQAEKRAEEEVKERELEEGYAKQLEEMLPPAMEKTDAAEDEVEKVAVAAAPLQIDAADDLRPVMLQAIKETEQRVRAAQAAIGEARRFISGKLTQVGRFAPQAKKAAVEEFTALQTRLSEAQNKLNPFKTVRQDYEQRSQFKKLHEELSAKAASAEIEVEKAAMMVAPLGADSAEGMKETEAALSTAQSAISQTLRLIDAKCRSAERAGGLGGIKDDIKSLQERAKAAQEKLDEVRKSMKETQIRVAADTLLREISERVAHAEDELQRMSEAELPFYRGEKGQDMEGLIAQADEAATKAHTALAEGQTFVARKLVEVARFTEGPAKAVKEEIDMLHKRLEDGRERLQQFRASLADRKRSHLLEEVDAKVKGAEEEVLRLAEATQAITNLGAAGEAAPEGAREAVEQANLAERAAQASLVVARKYLLQRTADLKKLAVAGGGSGSELGRLQTRVNNVQQEIAKFRNVTKDAEERLRVKQMVGEVASRLQMTEAEVDRVASAAVSSSKDLASEPNPVEVEGLEKATKSASTKLTATANLVDVKLKSAAGFLREELVAMRSKISAAEKKLASVVAAAKEQKERLLCSEMVAEATAQVESAEAAVTKSNDAELPFLKGLENLPAAEAAAAVAACETAATSAQRAVGAARTLVVQKLVDIKEFSQAPADACAKDLAALQKRLDVCAGKLAELKRDTAERKRKTQMQVSGAKVAKVEAAVQKLADTMTKFPDDKLGDLDHHQAQAVCIDIGQVEHEAQAAVADAKKFLAQRALDAKNSSDASRGAMTADLAKFQSRLTQCQVELAKLSKQCTEREQRFVAQKLVQDANANIKLLREEVEKATAAAQPLLADDKSALLASTHAHAAACALLGSARAAGSSAGELFSAIAGGKACGAEAFAQWLAKSPEAAGEEGGLSDERALEVARLVGPSGTVKKADFERFLCERFVCAEAAEAWSAREGGQAVDKVEAGEGLELLASGEGRSEFLCARSGAKVWIAMDAVQAAPASSAPGRVESIEAYVRGVHQRCTEASQNVDQKTVDLAHVKTGPLVEVKAKLQEIRGLLAQERAKADALKKRVAAARAGLAQQRKQELQQGQEQRCRAFATRCVSECTAAVESAEAKAQKVVDSAKAGGADKLQKELSIPALQALKAFADEALLGIAEAKSAIARAQEQHESYKGARNLLLESRVELTKLASRCATADRKLRSATEAVQAAYEQAARTATVQARAALRAAARKSGRSADALFDEVAEGKAEISLKKFSAFVKKLPDHGLSDEQVALVYHEFGKHGLRKPIFAKVLQEFCMCDKGTEITAELDPTSTQVRKIEKGELFEVTEGPAEPADGQPKRVRGRALRDGATGWVTLKGTDGAAILKPREKPFLAVTHAVPLHNAFDAESATVRSLQQDEVLELLEGPRPLEAKSELCLRCTASKDGAAGWVTLKDGDGNSSASPSKSIYVCRSTIAMTDGFDIANCKVLRKVDVGEALEVVGGQEQADAAKSISRLQFRAVRDGLTGWVTLRGNQGTVYTEASDCHFVADKPLALRAGAAQDAEVVRQVAAGEVLSGAEPPREVRPAPRVGARARAVEDGAAGWIVFAPGPKAPVKPWKARYICRQPVDVTGALPLTGSAAVRRAEPGESFQVVDGPALDKASGKRRVRVATPGDGVVGWVTIRGEDGAPMLEAA